MITPDLPLAAAIAAAVLDQIEADRSINRENLAVAILGRMMLMEARAKATPQPEQSSDIDAKILAAAEALHNEMLTGVVISDLGTAIADAWTDLHLALEQAGKA